MTLTKEEFAEFDDWVGEWLAHGVEVHEDLSHVHGHDDDGTVRFCGDEEPHEKHLASKIMGIEAWCLGVTCEDMEGHETLHQIGNLRDKVVKEIAKVQEIRGVLIDLVAETDPDMLSQEQLDVAVNRINEIVDPE